MRNLRRLCLLVAQAHHLREILAMKYVLVCLALLVVLGLASHVSGMEPHESVPPDVQKQMEQTRGITHQLSSESDRDPFSLLCRFSSKERASVTAALADTVRNIVEDI